MMRFGQVRTSGLDAKRIKQLGGGCGSRGREGGLLIARLAVRSPTPPRSCAEVSLSKTLNPKLLSMGRPASCTVAPPPSVCVSEYEWVNERQTL